MLKVGKSFGATRGRVLSVLYIGGTDRSVPGVWCLLRAGDDAVLSGDASMWDAVNFVGGDRCPVTCLCCSADVSMRCEYLARSLCGVLVTPIPLLRVVMLLSTDASCWWLALHHH